MSQNEQTYWKIHDFLKDRLKGDALRDFQQEIVENETLRKEVEMHRIANKLIINNRLTAAKQTSFNIQKTEKQAELYKKIAIGTAISIIIISAIYLIFNKQQANQVKINSSSIGRKNATVYLDNGRFSDLVNGKLNQTLAQQHSIETKEASSKEVSVPISNSNKNELLFIKNTETILPKQTETKQEIAVESVLAKKEIENFCLKTVISAITFASTTCVNENEGSISVSDFKGGQAPYKFEIVSEVSGNILKNNRLAGGKYAVVITDDNHCKATIENIVVKEVNCANAEEAFNPFLGETFQLDAFPKAGTFVVHEKTGAIVYKTQVLADEKIEWNGMSQNGELETGHFAYEIVYEDGTRKNGSITITR